MTVYNRGEQVRARFRGGPAFFPGVIKRVNQDGTYAINYSDGDFEPCVPASLIQHQNRQQNNSNDSNNRRSSSQNHQMRGVSDGLEMETMEESSQQHRNANNEYRQLDNNEARHNMRDSQAAFFKGDRVTGLFRGDPKNGRFPGSISRVHSDGTYDIIYDDNDTDAHLPARHIAPLSNNDNRNRNMDGDDYDENEEGGFSRSKDRNRTNSIALTSDCARAIERCLTANLQTLKAGTSVTTKHKNLLRTCQVTDVNLPSGMCDVRLSNGSSEELPISSIRSKKDGYLFVDTTDRNAIFAAFDSQFDINANNDVPTSQMTSFIRRDLGVLDSQNGDYDEAVTEQELDALFNETSGRNRDTVDTNALIDIIHRIAHQRNSGNSGKKKNGNSNRIDSLALTRALQTADVIELSTKLLRSSPKNGLVSIGVLTKALNSAGVSQSHALKEAIISSFSDSKTGRINGAAMLIYLGAQTAIAKPVIDVVHDVWKLKSNYDELNVLEAFGATQQKGKDNDQTESLFTSISAAKVVKMLGKQGLELTPRHAKALSRAFPGKSSKIIPNKAVDEIHVEALMGLLCLERFPSLKGLAGVVGAHLRDSPEYNRLILDKLQQSKGYSNKTLPWTEFVRTMLDTSGPMLSAIDVGILALSFQAEKSNKNGTVSCALLSKWLKKVTTEHAPDSTSESGSDPNGPKQEFVSDSNDEGRGISSMGLVSSEAMQECIAVLRETSALLCRKQKRSLDQFVKQVVFVKDTTGKGKVSTKAFCRAVSAWDEMEGFDEQVKALAGWFATNEKKRSGSISFEAALKFLSTKPLTHDIIDSLQTLRDSSINTRVKTCDALFDDSVPIATRLSHAYKQHPTKGHTHAKRAKADLAAHKRSEQQFLAKFATEHKLKQPISLINLLHGYDKKSTGTVTKREFELAVKRCCPGVKKVAITTLSAFYTLDESGGRVCYVNLCDVLDVCPSDAEVVEQRVGRLIDVAHRDGGLDFESALLAADTKGVGKLSVAKINSVVETLGLPLTNEQVRVLVHKASQVYGNKVSRVSITKLNAVVEGLVGAQLKSLDVKETRKKRGNESSDDDADSSNEEESESDSGSIGDDESDSSNSDESESGSDDDDDRGNRQRRKKKKHTQKKNRNTRSNSLHSETGKSGMAASAKKGASKWFQKLRAAGGNATARGGAAANMNDPGDGSSSSSSWGEGAESSDSEGTHRDNEFDGNGQEGQVGRMSAFKTPGYMPRKLRKRLLKLGEAAQAQDPQMQHKLIGVLAKSDRKSSGRVSSKSFIAAIKKHGFGELNKTDCGQAAQLFAWDSSHHAGSANSGGIAVNGGVHYKDFATCFLPEVSQSDVTLVDKLRISARTQLGGINGDVLRAFNKAGIKAKGKHSLSYFAKETLPKLGLKLSKSERRVLLDMLDRDNKGSVDVKHLTAMILPTCDSQNMDDNSRNNTAALEAKLRGCLGSLRAQGYKLDRLFDHYDSNGSEAISFVKFRRMLEDLALPLNDTEICVLADRLDGSGGMWDEIDYGALSSFAKGKGKLRRATGARSSHRKGRGGDDIEGAEYDSDYSGSSRERDVDSYSGDESFSNGEREMSESDSYSDSNSRGGGGIKSPRHRNKSNKKGDWRGYNESSSSAHSDSDESESDSHSDSSDASDVNQSESESEGDNGGWGGNHKGNKSKRHTPIARVNASSLNAFLRKAFSLVDSRRSGKVTLGQGIIIVRAIGLQVTKNDVVKALPHSCVRRRDSTSAAGPNRKLDTRHNSLNGNEDGFTLSRNELHKVASSLLAKPRRMRIHESMAMCAWFTQPDLQRGRYCLAADLVTHLVDKCEIIGGEESPIISKSEANVVVKVLDPRDKGKIYFTDFFQLLSPKNNRQLHKLIKKAKLSSIASRKCETAILNGMLGQRLHNPTEALNVYGSLSSHVAPSELAAVAYPSLSELLSPERMMVTVAVESEEEVVRPPPSPSRLRRLSMASEVNTPPVLAEDGTIQLHIELRTVKGIPGPDASFARDCIVSRQARVALMWRQQLPQNTLGSLHALVNGSNDSKDKDKELHSYDHHHNHRHKSNKQEHEHEHDYATSEIEAGDPLAQLSPFLSNDHVIPAFCDSGDEESWKFTSSSKRNNDEAKPSVFVVHVPRHLAEFASELCVVIEFTLTVDGNGGDTGTVNNTSTEISSAWCAIPVVSESGGAGTGSGRNSPRRSAGTSALNVMNVVLFGGSPTLSSCLGGNADTTGRAKSGGSGGWGLLGRTKSRKGDGCEVVVKCCRADAHASKVLRVLQDGMIVSHRCVKFLELYRELLAINSGGGQNNNRSLCLRSFPRVLEDHRLFAEFTNRYRQRDSGGSFNGEERNPFDRAMLSLLPALSCGGGRGSADVPALVAVGRKRGEAIGVLGGGALGGSTSTLASHRNTAAKTRSAEPASVLFEPFNVQETVL